jgi:hypothetical protein
LINSYTKFHITIFGISPVTADMQQAGSVLSDRSVNILLCTQINVLANVAYLLEVFDVCFKIQFDIMPMSLSFSGLEDMSG